MRPPLRLATSLLFSFFLSFSLSSVSPQSEMSSIVGQYADELIENAKRLAMPGKGILAADESTTTIGKRLASIGVENTEANRKAYRELLFTCPNVLPQYISGVILFEETLYQTSSIGIPFVHMLSSIGVLPGIKVDRGTVEIPGTSGETTTQGLDDLAARCQKYYEAGARFAKWRAVLRLGPGGEPPSELAIAENAHGLARYAIICQENGLVPIVEPEDGSHGIQQCAVATERVLAAVYKALSDHRVLLEGTLLKPNMVTPGADGPPCDNPVDVAGFTLQALQRTVPVAVPGIMFLSGGQSEESATVNLNAMNKMKAVRPWVLSFSYGRALQESTLKAWSGKKENIPIAQKTLLIRCKANSEATLGKYTVDSNSEGSNHSLYERNYKY